MVYYGIIPWFCTMDYFSQFSTFLLKIFTPIHIQPFQAAVARPWSQQLNTSVVRIVNMETTFCASYILHHGIDVWYKCIDKSD